MTHQSGEDCGPEHILQKWPWALARWRGSTEISLLNIPICCAWHSHLSPAEPAYSPGPHCGVLAGLELARYEANLALTEIPSLGCSRVGLETFTTTPGSSDIQ